MKSFEHEVLGFDLSTDKGHQDMRQKLQEWGKAGYEIVSVVPSNVGFSSVNIFLKRELDGAQSSESEAA
jgi:hypothetical protein